MLDYPGSTNLTKGIKQTLNEYSFGCGTFVNDWFNSWVKVQRLRITHIICIYINIYIYKYIYIYIYVYTYIYYILYIYILYAYIIYIYKCIFQITAYNRRDRDTDLKICQLIN